MGLTGPFRDSFLDKIDARDRRPLGKAGMTAAEAIAAKATRDEKADHRLVLDWCSRNEVDYIHAPTWRRVHDLPRGWPDFTFIWGDRHLYVELKSARGRLSEAQKAVKARLESQGATVYVKYSYEQTKRLVMGWLWEVGRWTAFDPE